MVFFGIGSVEASDAHVLLSRWFNVQSAECNEKLLDKRPHDVSV